MREPSWCGNNPAPRPKPATPHTTGNGSFAVQKPSPARKFSVSCAKFYFNRCDKGCLGFILTFRHGYSNLWRGWVSDIWASKSNSNTLDLPNVESRSPRHQVQVILPTPPLKLMVAIDLGAFLSFIFCSGSPGSAPPRRCV